MYTRKRIDVWSIVLISISTYHTTLPFLLNKLVLQEKKEAIICEVTNLKCALEKTPIALGQFGAFFADSLSSTLSYWRGETVTAFELKMFPMFYHFPDLKNLLREFEVWFAQIGEKKLQEINNILHAAKKQRCSTADLFNEQILHMHSVKRFFPAEPNMSVEDFNKKVKQVKSEDYADEMFFRISCYVLFKQVVLPEVQNL